MNNNILPYFIFNSVLENDLYKYNMTNLKEEDFIFGYQISNAELN